MIQTMFCTCGTLVFDPRYHKIINDGLEKYLKKVLAHALEPGFKSAVPFDLIELGARSSPQRLLGIKIN